MTDFFDTIEPVLYDLSLPYVVPGVDVARQLRHLAFCNLVDVVPDLVGVDVGIGTGSDCATLLPSTATGRLIGIDNSLHLTRDVSEAGRLPEPGPSDVSVEVLIGDFTQGEVANLVLQRFPDGVDFVSSAFAIHNVPIASQRAAFSKIARMLKVGGTFFYLDLITYDDDRLRDAANSADAEFIERQMSTVPDETDPACWHRLQSRWLDHYRNENFLAPLTSARQDSVQRMLSDAGFGQPEILFRLHNTALLIARRDP